jgi:DNA-binding CsgD family transcriptional regulator
MIHFESGGWMSNKAAAAPVGRHTSATSRQEEWLEHLRSIRARFELLETERERGLLVASAAGHSQREIAHALGESQATVHRLLARARARQQVDQNPRAIKARHFLLKFLAGDLSRGELLGRLKGVAPGVVAPGNQVDGYISGSWDEVRTAYLDGLINSALYEYLRTQLRPHYEGRDGES